MQNCINNSSKSFQSNAIFLQYANLGSINVQNQSKLWSRNFSNRRVISLKSWSTNMAAGFGFRFDCAVKCCLSPNIVGKIQLAVDISVLNFFVAVSKDFNAVQMFFRAPNSNMSNLGKSIWFARISPPILLFLDGIWFCSSALDCMSWMAFFCSLIEFSIARVEFHRVQIGWNNNLNIKL